MNFAFTSSAVEQLESQLGNKNLKLLYDTEGCGCVANGIPTLLIVDQPDPQDKLGEGTPFSVWYDPNYDVFFEPNLKIDFNKARNAFVLRSDNEIYTANLRLLKL